MKKFAVSLVAVLAVIIMAFSFTACSAKGKYKFESVTIANKTYKAGEEIPFVGKIDKDDFVLELNKDGSCSIKTYNNDSLKTGTWKEEDGKIKFDVEGISIGEATRDGNKISFYFVIGTFTLKK